MISSCYNGIETKRVSDDSTTRNNTIEVVEGSTNKTRTRWTKRSSNRKGLRLGDPVEMCKKKKGQRKISNQANEEVGEKKG
jgi:hypothetical protein